MNDEKMEMGRTVYNTICAALDEAEIKYDRHDETLFIDFRYKGEDMIHNQFILVNPEREAIQWIDRLPFAISSEKSAEMALAVCTVNDRLLAGRFSYNGKEQLQFEMTQLYTGGLVSKALIKRITFMCYQTVEDFDDKFMALNKGYLKINDFFKE